MATMENIPSTPFIRNYLHYVRLSSIAISSIANYDELTRKARELAAKEYYANRENEQLAQVYNYIMARYDIDENQLINILSVIHMLTFAKKSGSEPLIEYYYKSHYLFPFSHTKYYFLG